MFLFPNRLQRQKNVQLWEREKERVLADSQKKWDWSSLNTLTDACSQPYSLWTLVDSCNNHVFVIDSCMMDHRNRSSVCFHWGINRGTDDKSYIGLWRPNRVVYRYYLFHTFPTRSLANVFATRTRFYKHTLSVRRMEVLEGQVVDLRRQNASLQKKYSVSRLLNFNYSQTYNSIVRAHTYTQVRKHANVVQQAMNYSQFKKQNYSSLCVCQNLRTVQILQNSPSTYVYMSEFHTACSGTMFKLILFSVKAAT